MIVQPDGFIYDPETRRHSIGGRRALSVTEVLALNDLYKGMDFFTPEGLILGRHIHTACEWYDDRTLEESTLDDGLRGYLESWKSFCQAALSRILLIEEPMCDPVNRFVGKLDRLVLIADIPWILDIKHGSRQPCAEKLQTAGYQLLTLRHPIMADLKVKTIKRGCVRVHPDGKMATLEPHDDPCDIPTFLSFLNTTMYKLNHGFLQWEAA